MNNSTGQVMDEHYIRQHIDEVNWSHVCKHQQLSEQFMRDFSHLLDWRSVSRYQRLSENFIREFKDRIDWLDLSMNRNTILGEDLKRDFSYQLYIQTMPTIPYNHGY